VGGEEPEGLKMDDMDRGDPFILFKCNLSTSELSKICFFCLVFSVSIITDTTLQAKDATESFEGRNCLQVLVQNMIRIVLLSLKSKKRKYPRHQSSEKK